jgi:hypothetical protein
MQWFWSRMGDRRPWARRGAVALTLGLVAVSGPALGVGGSPAPAAGYDFMARIHVGDPAFEACTGALIDPAWIVTDRSCFTQVGGIVPSVPWLATTATVGSTGARGQVRSIVEVVSHPDRNLVVARLATPITAYAPVRIGTRAPAVGEELTVAGFGRTATEWVPDRVHVGSFSVRTVAAATVSVEPASQTTPATICKGDAGAPVVRPTGSGVELVGVTNEAGQGGCFGVPATQTGRGAVQSRVDDLTTWVRQVTRGGLFQRVAGGVTVLDTRSGIGAAAGQRPGGSYTEFQVTGVGGATGIPSSGVAAVLADVTAVTTGGTVVTLNPMVGSSTPALYAAPNQTISNATVMPVAANGRITIHTTGAAHLVVDVQGYYTTAGGAGDAFVPVAPTRVADTRSGLGGHTGRIAPGTSRTYTLTGGVIPAGAQSALLDVIVTGATGNGWISAVPPGTAGTRSVMDYGAGTTSHAVSVRLGANGEATFTNNGASAVDLVLTAVGYFSAQSATGLGLRPLPTTRMFDSQTWGDRTPIAANATFTVQVRLPAGTIAVLNLVVVDNKAAGHLRAWPVGGTEPSTSLTTYPSVGTGPRAGLAVVQVGASGQVTLRNASSGTAHVAVDLQGWFAPPMP